MLQGQARRLPFNVPRGRSIGRMGADHSWTCEWASYTGKESADLGEPRTTHPANILPCSGGVEGSIASAAQENLINQSNLSRSWNRVLWQPCLHHLLDPRSVSEYIIFVYQIHKEKAARGVSHTQLDRDAEIAHVPADGCRLQVFLLRGCGASPLFSKDCLN